MIRSLAVLIFALASCPAASAQKSSPAGTASVIDGDTIEIHGERIRLNGFDAPERGKKCGSVNVYQRASLALSDFIGRSTVKCESTGEKDNYNRLVAQCSVKGVDLGDHMVRQGWARDWPRYSGGRYRSAEAEARSNRRGVWQVIARTLGPAGTISSSTELSVSSG